MTQSNPSQQADDGPPSNQGDSPREVVLSLRKLTYRGESESTLTMREVDLDIRQGELVMIHIDRAQSSRELVSMLQGLHPPQRGHIKFEGEDWRGSDFGKHFQMRNRIGRVFEGRAWINNLNVSENVLLAATHQGRSASSQHREVAKWSERLLVPTLTRERPAFVESSRLQRYQWLRAFLGDPSLLLLERPMKSLDAKLIEPLVSAVNQVRQRSAAVLWFAGTENEAVQSFPEPVFHYRLQAGELVMHDVQVRSSEQRRRRRG